MPDIPDFDDIFPDWCDKPQCEVGLTEVPVKEIVGGNALRSKEYYDNWSIKRADSRYNSIEQKILDEALDRQKVKEILDTIGGNASIDLACFNVKGDRFCFVSADGHRRVSLAHKFGVESIQADVFEIEM